MRVILAVIFAFSVSSPLSGQTYTISTVAGGGLPVNIAANSISLSPSGLVADGAGNIFFLFGNAVLRWDASTGMLSLAAGNGTPGYSGDNGLAMNAQLNNVFGIAVDASGNLFVADEGNAVIRKVANGVITTVAGNGISGFSGDNGPATSARLSAPEGVAIDPAGILYIADGNRIRKVSNGVITTIAGNGTAGYSGDNGPAINAQLNDPGYLTVDASGTIYFSDYQNNVVRRISDGVVTTFAGNGTAGSGGDNGPATNAQLNRPAELAADSSGNLYITDSNNVKIRKVSNGMITTVAGNGSPGYSGDGGPAASARLNYIDGVTLDSSGNIYIGDGGNGRIRKVSSGMIATVAGGGATFTGDGGPATNAPLGPEGVAVDQSGSLYIADEGDYRVRKVSNGIITTVAGNGTYGYSGDGGPAANAQLGYPSGLTVDSAGNLYIAEIYTNRIRKVVNGVITTVAGNGTAGFSGDGGPATNAQLNLLGYGVYGLVGIAVDTAGSLYIADTGNNRVRKVSNGVITTVAGNGTAGFSGDGGSATNAQLTMPAGITLDAQGNLYIADAGNGRIRKVSGGVISTIAGGGTVNFPADNSPATSARFSPTGVAVDLTGNLFISDIGASRVLRVSGSSIFTIAGITAFDANGQGVFGGDNGPAISAELYSPTGVTLDGSGNIYVSDSYNGRVRELTTGTAPQIAPGGIVPIYSSVSAIQPGSWVSIYGTNLASATAVWNNNFPTSLGGVTVTIDGKPAYLWVVSVNQINLQVPDNATTGVVPVVVTTPSGTATSTVTLAQQGPSFSLLGDGKHVAGEILTAGGIGAYGAYDLVGPFNTFSYSTRPVKAGETLVLYGVGFGPTTPMVPAGKAFSGAASTNNPVSVTIGGVSVNVTFAGIVQAGLYQFNLTVPANTGIGDQPLQATVNGVKTPTGAVVTIQ